MRKEWRMRSERSGSWRLRPRNILFGLTWYLVRKWCRRCHDSTTMSSFWGPTCRMRSLGNWWIQSRRWPLWGISWCRIWGIAGKSIRRGWKGRAAFFHLFWTRFWEGVRSCWGTLGLWNSYRPLLILVRRCLVSFNRTCWSCCRWRLRQCRRPFNLLCFSLDRGIEGARPSCLGICFGFGLWYTSYLDYLNGFCRFQDGWSCRCYC